MAKPQKKTNPIVELCLCIFLGYLGGHRFYTGKIKSGVLYLFTGGICGIGWLVDIILIALRLRQVSALKKSATHNVSTVSSNAVPSYEYEDVRFYPPADMIKKVPKHLLTPGVRVDLQTEPHNEYDNRAVALYVSGHQIGYLLRGTLQDMANDYLRQGYPIVATLTSFGLAAGEYQGFISLAFYKESTHK